MRHTTYNIRLATYDFNLTTSIMTLNVTDLYCLHMSKEIQKKNKNHKQRKLLQNITDLRCRIIPTTYDTRHTDSQQITSDLRFRICWRNRPTFCPCQVVMVTSLARRSWSTLSSNTPVKRTDFTCFVQRLRSMSFINWTSSRKSPACCWLRPSGLRVAGEREGHVLSVDWRHRGVGWRVQWSVCRWTWRGIKFAFTNAAKKTNEIFRYLSENKILKSS